MIIVIILLGVIGLILFGGFILCAIGLFVKLWEIFVLGAKFYGGK